jgi:hypothetical protein
MPHPMGHTGGIAMNKAVPSMAGGLTVAGESGGIAGGFLSGATPGRADALRTSAPGGSYVIPADVVSGIGQGNSAAGARFLKEAFSSGPWGTPLRAAGGSVPAVPVMLSDGEYVVSPEDVARLGGGSMKKGHQVLDHFVESQRKKHIKKLKALPGPVKGNR